MEQKPKVKLQELKGKIKMPDIPADEPPEGKPKWTPEIEKTQKTGWTTVNEKMIAEFAKIPIFYERRKGTNCQLCFTRGGKEGNIDKCYLTM